LIKSASRGGGKTAAATAAKCVLKVEREKVSVKRKKPKIFNKF